MAELSESQQAALDQLRQITDGQDPDRELAVLESVGWNVEKAVHAFFDDDTPSQAGPSTSRKVEQMDVDDSQQSTTRRRPSQNRSPPPRPIAGPGLGLNLVSVITFPFTLISNILQFVFRILRIPFFGLFRGTGITGLRGPGGPLRPSGGRGAVADDPASVVDRFVRELEDETGAMSVSHATSAASETSDVGPSSSSSSSHGKTAVTGKLLPDFYVGSYESALKAAEKDLKVLCIILLSSEHDDVPEFRRNVLTDPDLVRVLTDNEFLVWGGDIRERGAYQASQKLGATTYPFVAFVSLHPVPTHLGGPSRTHSGSGPKLTVLSRHEGPPSSTTSAQTLHAHITTSLLPRVTPLLSRLRTERWNREQERALREEQDRAFQEAAARDRERVLQKQEAERRAAAEAEARAAEEHERASRVEKTAAWRRYARKHLVPREPEGAGNVRIGVRLPNGKRAIRKFAPTDDASSLYAFVETLFIPDDQAPSEDPDEAPTSYTHEWAFSVITSFPRREIPSEGTILGSIEELKGGANLVVELTGPTVPDEDESSSEDDE